MSGRAGSERLRGRVLAGFTRDGAMRLEGLAPFGPPAFVLVARPARAVLWLPRDKRVIEHASAAEILGALTGVPLAPRDLLAVVTGCVAPMATVTGGRIQQRGWATLDLGGGAALFLQRAYQAWEVRAARRAGWEIEYAMWQSGLPRQVHLRSTEGSTPVDATVQLSQIETNTIAKIAASDMVHLLRYNAVSTDADVGHLHRPALGTPNATGAVPPAPMTRHTRRHFRRGR